MAIRTSHGRVATVNGLPTPYLYGSGHGKDAELAVLGKKAADLLDKAFHQDIEIRGNSGGKDVGAHHDGDFGFSLSAWRQKDESIIFTGGFEARVGDADAILAEVPTSGGYHLDQESRDFEKKMGGTVTKVSCYSPQFKTLEDAFVWLKQYGVKFCPTLQALQPRQVGERE